MESFLWGVTLGWAFCAVFFYSQTENNERAGNGAAIIFIALVVIALVFTINLGISSGAITPPR